MATDTKDKIAPFGLQCSNFTPFWILSQTIIFAISTGLAVFDTYTDWEVVLKFKETGFNNPLLPADEHWIRAWFLFASIGTLLTVVSFLHDSIELLYSCYKYLSSKQTSQTSESPTESHTNMSSHPNEEIKKETKNKEDIPDPLKCCFRHGWNATTRKETLGAFTLWFQDVPMLTMSVLFALVQHSCKTPDLRDVTPILQSVGISATAAVISSCWRLIRSIVRLNISLGVRGTFKNKWKCFKKCLPKANEAAYPPNTCAQHCILPFYFGLCMQFLVISAGVGIIFTIWLFFGLLKTGSKYDSSLGIYRFSITDTPDSLLFNISGTIFPPNGTFVNLEKIPYAHQPGIIKQDIYCLSEFEYRSEKSEIFFNAIQIIPVTYDGKFCEIRSGQFHNNSCYFYYTYNNFVLYYASVDPNFGKLERFDEECLLVKDMIGYRASPKVDLSINVSRHINRTSHPTNNKQLVIYYRNLRRYVKFSDVQDADHRGLEILVSNIDDKPFQYKNITFFCVGKYFYSYSHKAVLYNYKGVRTDQGLCRCESISSVLCHYLLYKRAVYGFLVVEDSGARVVPYTECSSISYDDIIPQFDSSLSVTCPCKH